MGFHPVSTSLALAIVCLLLEACEIRHRSTPPRLATPPDSGELTIEMTGSWRMQDLEYIATSRGLLPENPGIRPLEKGRGVLPPADGAVVVIATGMFWTANGQSLLFQDVTGHRGNEDYVNQADGKTARFEYVFRNGSAPDAGVTTFQIAAGSIDADTMRGFMFFAGFGPPDGAQNREGLYSFTLVRQ